MADPKLLNIAQWRELGMVPRKGEEPRKVEKRFGGGVIKFYDESQVRPIAKRRKPDPRPVEVTPENVALACWTVNRTAKRYRDAASTYYRQRQHGFAGTSRQKKMALYRLKDIAIAWLATKGGIVSIRIHGGLSLWEGLGYRFHSTLTVKDLPRADDDMPLTIEAKPKGSGEMRLIDAESLLQGLPDYTLNYQRLEVPRLAEQNGSGSTLSWSIGEAGDREHEDPYDEEFDDDEEW
jgi:hypothetical protein